jgi:hypothetical protein
MTVAEFRHRHFISHALGFEQRNHVIEAYRWGDAASAWASVCDAMATKYAIKAAHFAFCAFPELREGI